MFVCASKDFEHYVLNVDFKGDVSVGGRPMLIRNTCLRVCAYVDL